MNVNESKAAQESNAVKSFRAAVAGLAGLGDYPKVNSDAIGTLMAAFEAVVKELAETKAELEQAKQCLNGEKPHWTTLLSSALNPKEP